MAPAQIRHALRTPINHILGYCDVLLAERELPATFREDLERIQGGGRQLLNLMNEHFDLSSTLAPQDLHQLSHDLRTPVHHVVGFCELLQDEARKIGKPQFIPDLRKIHEAARTCLALMEKNLSLRPAAATQPHTSASALPVHEPATDTTIRGSREVPSAGTDEKEQGRPQPAPARRVAAKEQGGALLIVDDDQDARDLLARRFQHHGYQVAIAANGIEAIELILAREFDLVLLDLIMPGLGGLEVLKRVRQRRSMAELPVIVLTGMDSSASVVEALRLGANDYLTKPASFTEVHARAQTHLKLKRAQSQLKARMEEVRKLAAALEKRNRFIQQVFGRYVTDAIVQALLETPEGLKLGGEKREVTVLMSDLRGFTALAENLPPECVVEMLNIHLGQMTEIISAYDGVIDEFIGDAILAIFGAPIRKDDHCERAVACALSMQLAMSRVNEQLERVGRPRLAMGIAVNTGQVVVGNIGSAKRAKFGVVGTPVNVTARIQEVTRAGQVLIAEATASRLGTILLSRAKTTLVAKGITGPLTLYDVAGLGGQYNLRLPDQEDN